MRLLENWPERKPLPRSIKGISALRVNITLPGKGLNIESKLRCALIKRQKITRDDLAASLSILRRKHISLFANSVTAEDALLSRLRLSAVKIVMGGNITNEREVFRAPKPLAKEQTVFYDARVLKLFGSGTLRGRKRRIEFDLIQRSCRHRTNTGIGNKSSATGCHGYLAASLLDVCHRHTY